jgi:hypothetical protein
MWTSLKLAFADSLVCSRLLFNVHVAVPTAKYLSILNGPYMRMLRRIFGEPRFERSAVSDFEVRRALGQPSIDCRVMSARLRFLPRVILHAPPVLRALLYDSGGCGASWTRLVCNDLEYAWHRSPMCSNLPHPEVDPEAWQSLITSNLWPSVVRDCHFVESVLDRSKSCDRHSPSQLSGEFECGTCASCGVAERFFSSNQALLSHQRAKHGFRCSARFFASSSGICMCCKSMFVTRLRLLRHLTDRRRQCLAKLVAKNAPKLSERVVKELDLIDRESRREAQRLGRAHPRAVGSARNKRGAVVGHVDA